MNAFNQANKNYMIGFSALEKKRLIGRIISEKYAMNTRCIFGYAISFFFIHIFPATLAPCPDILFQI
jgi:hypothetical protein